MSPTSYQTAPPRTIMVAYVPSTVKPSTLYGITADDSAGSNARHETKHRRARCYDDTLMAPPSRANTWFVLEALWLLASGCGSQPADLGALPSWVASYPGSPP